jgi:hypothetical protein
MALGVSRDVVATAQSMLADAYELVLSGWCQGASAQDEGGRSIEPSSAFARRWSAPGALERVWRRTGDADGVALDAYERASLALAAAARDVPQRWNDVAERRLDEVLDALALAVQSVQLDLGSPLEEVEEFIEEAHRGDRPGLFVVD